MQMGGGVFLNYKRQFPRIGFSTFGLRSLFEVALAFICIQFSHKLQNPAAGRLHNQKLCGDNFFLIFFRWLLADFIAFLTSLARAIMKWIYIDGNNGENQTVFRQSMIIELSDSTIL
jgi:hypothetical protein